ncbi:A/G-specific adenine glycosylase [Rubrivivax gelatinosus]|uniref:Adenine DNA glycosylase n=1 Tax=Rubrivivax gelatinosus TaxID=28068 RepID=A0ABS1E1R1_RUBGE|nr:A/G-specific adenine glycosylase [Rubrivivax gelatinosus]MBK1715810.1 A/G-specific adenine glycosylase [Rubrivivax gelatinosus]
MPARGIAGRVVRWQREHGRHALPWQNTRDPYRIWLSEVMLQQTQVTTVLAYYARFLERFPEVAALAAAPLDEVLALWSGLGYYSRARNLHRCAQAVVAEHGGRFPGTAAELATLPGIGRSTAAAVAAFAYGERAAILDGNVKRVLARATGFAGDLARPAEQRALWSQAEALLPEHDIERYTQGLMDLGATVCLARRPQCGRCPLEEVCIARAEGAPERYPVKTRTLRRGRRRHALLWLEQGERVRLVQRPETGVWAGLWSLPEYESAEALAALVAGWPGQGGWLAPFEHVLTHFDWTLEPLRWTLPPAQAAEPGTDDVEAALPPGRWFTRAEALALGLPAPVRRLLEAG